MSQQVTPLQQKRIELMRVKQEASQIAGGVQRKIVPTGPVRSRPAFAANPAGMGLFPSRPNAQRLEAVLAKPKRKEPRFVTEYGRQAYLLRKRRIELEKARLEKALFNAERKAQFLSQHRGARWATRFGNLVAGSGVRAGSFIGQEARDRILERYLVAQRNRRARISRLSR